jgi:hypothetical protein
MLAAPVKLKILRSTIIHYMKDTLSNRARHGPKKVSRGLDGRPSSPVVEEEDVPVPPTLAERLMLDSVLRRKKDGDGSRFFYIS